MIKKVKKILLEKLARVNYLFKYSFVGLKINKI